MKKIMLLGCMLIICTLSIQAQSRGKMNARGGAMGPAMELKNFENKIVSDDADSKAVDLIEAERELQQKLAEAKKAKTEYLTARYPEYKKMIDSMKERRENRTSARRNRGQKRKLGNRLNRN